MLMRFNEGWQFSLGEADDLKPVVLPHDWLIGDMNNWYKSGVGWYQKTLDARFLKPGQRVFLRFDGVYMNSTLYVNRQKAGEWKNGFTAFEYDITALLNPDENNVLLLKVDARFPSGRWYTGAGVYRDVTLVIKNACHFAENGIYISSFQDEKGVWQYEATAEIEGEEGNCQVFHEILEKGERLPWSPESPNLYTLRSTLYQNGKRMDVADTRFGFRSLQFAPERGFLLNGEKIKLNGVCLHQEFSITGSAVHRDLIARQFEALKRMGVNAVRTAHNAPSRAFMELCDEMGLMVVSEFSDVWQISKTEYDYARYFDAWHEKDVKSWIRRDRNSPSVIMWSLGNEIPDTNADVEKGGAILEKLAALVKVHDPRGQAVPTLGSNYMAWEKTRKAVSGLTAVGYNYAEFLYQKHHEEYPNWVIYGSEICSTVQSRGIYHFPLSQPTLSDDDLQVSSLGNSTTSWGALSIDQCIKDDRDTPFSMGQFVWSGQDYLGEPTPYQTKNSYFGMLDTAGFEKDAFYLFQSAWTDKEKNPMVHLFPYWDFSDGQLIDTRVCTNQHKVKLYLNGVLTGEAEMNGEITKNWRLPYAKGTLRAEAYDKNGQLRAAMSRESFGEVNALKLDYEFRKELCFVTIRAVDEAGRPVENANALIDVTVSGGELLGLDNGDASDYTPYQAASRRLFSGKLLAVIRRAPGQELAVKASLSRKFTPVRKIALSLEGNRIFAQCFPPEAERQELHWRVTNAAGTDSRLAEFIKAEDGRSIVLKPLGDGEVFVRCGVQNGKPHLDFYAQLSVLQTGVGGASLSPYAEISASLYTGSDAALESGLERGIATPRGQRSLVRFDKLDFGPMGSDEMSLWLFAMDNNPFDFEIWEGDPENGALLANPVYDLGFTWNVYREFRVKLKKKLRGETSLCFVFNRKLHLRGFVFHREQSALSWIKAGACSELYGDSYAREGDAILGIGNNTTVGFENLFLPWPGADRLEISFTGLKPDNPVQLQADHEQGRLRTMLNLSGRKAGETQIFELSETIRGRISLKLIFLPGCRVDLRAFRFLPAVQQTGAV